jgi:hypothetical protein
MSYILYIMFLNMYSTRRSKIEYVSNNVNMLNLDQKMQICKTLLTFGIYPRQTNNGVYCEFSELSDELLDVIYNYLIMSLQPKPP